MNKTFLVPLAIFGGALAIASIPTINGLRLARVAQAQAPTNGAAVSLLNDLLKALQNGDEA
ncbi:MAG: hypothetical protein JWN98_274, partial [Abditibacteriota bacterium]|nr:hypothetical protein [Abditibacteriota bacterium]